VSNNNAEFCNDRYCLRSADASQTDTTKYCAEAFQGDRYEVKATVQNHTCASMANALAQSVLRFPESRWH
jgi:hypothetical protein